MELPIEIISHIASFTTDQTAFRIGMTCKSLQKEMEHGYEDDFQYNRYIFGVLTKKVEKYQEKIPFYWALKGIKDEIHVMELAMSKLRIRLQKGKFTMKLVRRNFAVNGKFIFDVSIAEQYVALRTLKAMIKKGNRNVKVNMNNSYSTIHPFEFKHQMCEYVLNDFGQLIVPKIIMA